MKITATFHVSDSAAKPLPKWLRVLEALAEQHNGRLTVTTTNGKVVTR
jgi:hypothetical protein